MEKLINAFVLTEKNKPLQFFKLKTPELKFGQVLVKIEYCGVCRSQLMDKKGLRGKDKWLPHLLGHEGSGVIIKIGKGVKKVKIGDKVILTWIESNGTNSKNPKYLTDKNIQINSGKVTTFSNYSVVSENRVIKKPNLLKMKHAPLFGCAIPTGAGIVLNQMKPKKNERVAVLGLGGIGLSSIMALKALKIKEIIAIDKNKNKLKLAKKLGATKIIFLQKGSKKFIENIDSDYCIESAGFASTIELGFSFIKKNGKLIFASHPDSSDYIKIKPQELISGKQIEGSWGGFTKPDKDVPKMLRIFHRNRIKYHLIGQKIYRLDEINEALKDLELGKVFRPIIKMEHQE